MPARTLFLISLLFAALGACGVSPTDPCGCNWGFAGDVAQCRANNPGNPFGFDLCVATAEAVRETCLSTCLIYTSGDSPGPNTHSYNNAARYAAVDVDYPSVDPLHVDHGDVVSIVAKSLKPFPLKEVLDSVPSILSTVTEWEAYRSKYFESEVNPGPVEAYFDTLELSVFNTLTPAERMDRDGLWIPLGIDSTPGDGFSTVVDTGLIPADFYVLRVVLEGRSPLKPIYGFGVLNVF